MKQDLSRMPVLDLELLVERTLLNGSMPESAMKYLMDGGIAEDLARKIVSDVDRMVKQRRDAELAEKIEIRNGNLRIAGGFFAVGAALFLFAYLDDRPASMIPGIVFCLFGIRRIRKMYLLGRFDVDAGPLPREDQEDAKSTIWL